MITFDIGLSVCGASLLSSTRTLTAAHCWADGVKQAEYLELVFGSEHVFFGGVRIISDDVIMHPGWDTSNISNDIAIVRHEKVEFTGEYNRYPLIDFS